MNHLKDNNLKTGSETFNSRSNELKEIFLPRLINGDY